jgi:transcriptional regulator with XRE-family HTH domain
VTSDLVGSASSARGSDFSVDLESRLEDPELAHEYREALERASLGLKIARLRAERGLSQAQLAERVKTTQSVISRYESADYVNYNLQTLRRLAAALDSELLVDFRGRTTKQVLPGPRGGAAPTPQSRSQRPVVADDIVRASWMATTVTAFIASSQMEMTSIQARGPRTTPNPRHRPARRFRIRGNDASVSMS